MRLLVLFILLALPAFFSASEVALLRLRPTRVQRLLKEGQHGAQAINRLQKRLRRALMVSQLGGTMALIAIGWLSKGVGMRLWPNDEATSSRFLDTGLFLTITLIATLIAGLLPKAIVLNRPERSALRLAPLLEAVMRCLTPVLSFVESITSILLRLVGLNTQWDELSPALSAGELETLIEKGGVTGLLPDERNILEGVFALRDTQVREVMVPRSGMDTLPLTVNFSDLMKEVHRTRHARFPVIGDSLDDIKGVLDLRQLAEPISKGIMQAETTLETYIQPAKIVLETSTLGELLPLIRSGQPFLVVVDEHGGTEGLVTSADLTGEIVGDEIETDKNEPDLLQPNNQEKIWIAAGDLEIIDLNRQLKLGLPEAVGHHTLAGFLLEKLQHVPFAGETLTYEGIAFEIIRMKGPRIERVKLILTKEDNSEV